MTEQYEMTRGEQRAAKKMLAKLKRGHVVVGHLGDLADRYRNYRKIPKHTTENKVKLEKEVSDFLGNDNWLEESRTYSGNAKQRMQWFFIHALDEKMEASLGDCEVGDMEWFEEVGWEEYTNNNLRIIKFVQKTGPSNRYIAHDFWFATDEDYAHNWSMENDEDYFHKWMMENDEDYRIAYEAEQAAKEAEENDS